MIFATVALMMVFVSRASAVASWAAVVTLTLAFADCPGGSPNPRTSRTSKSYAIPWFNEGTTMLILGTNA